MEGHLRPLHGRQVAPRRGGANRRNVAAAVAATTLVALALAVYGRIGSPVDAWRSYRCAAELMSRLSVKDYAHAAELFQPGRSAHDWPAIRGYRLAGLEPEGDEARITFNVVSDDTDEVVVTVAHEGDRYFVRMTDPPGI